MSLTARHLPFPKLRWKALDEIDAGVCDGLSYEDVATTMPEEYAARKKDKLGYRWVERWGGSSLYVMLWLSEGGPIDPGRPSYLLVHLIIQPTRSQTIIGTPAVSPTWMSSRGWSLSSLRWSVKRTRSA